MIKEISSQLIFLLFIYSWICEYSLVKSNKHPPFPTPRHWHIMIISICHLHMRNFESNSVCAQARTKGPIGQNVSRQKGFVWLHAFINLEHRSCPRCLLPTSRFISFRYGIRLVRKGWVRNCIYYVEKCILPRTKNVDETLAIPL